MAVRDSSQRQRLQHIVDSYSLAGSEEEVFYPILRHWESRHPLPLIELAVVEALVQTWLRLPRPTGTTFLKLVGRRLQQWQTPPVESAITRSQFEQVTGLDPSPIFGPLPPSEGAVPLSPETPAEWGSVRVDGF